METDADLLLRYAEIGTENAFAEIVRRHIDFVYQTALRQVGGDAHHAADVVQYVFTEVTRKAATLANHRVLKGWLFSTACHAAANIVRSEQRRRRREQEAHAMQTIANEPEPSADWMEVRPLINDALAALSARDREAVLLRYFEGRDYAEIGARFSLTADAARLRVDRALEKMRAALARAGVTSGAAALANTLAAQAGVGAPTGLAASVTATALASGATAGGGLTFLSLMCMTKIQTGAAVGLLIAAAIGIAVVHRQNAQLELELAGIRAQSGELTRLRMENVRLTQAEATNRVAQSELARLRSEIVALKNPAPTPPKPTVVTKAPANKEWRNLGQATPAAAMETLLAATQDFDIAALGKLIVFDPAKRKDVEEVFARVPQAAREKLKIFTAEEMLVLPWLFDRQGRFTGGEIAELGPRGPDDVAMSWKRLAADGQVENQQFDFHRGPDGWQWGLGEQMVEHQLADVRKKLLREVLGQQP